mmetsp:Transcript_27851/g.42165  ORF Transcript_27851/g.42165 Transcript_27851/m.42165 type:complete len:270 (-) Transcript_27851:910-1719(-)
MSDTASFVDPVFLARFGLSRMNALDYFLHPLNPFRTSKNTSNEVLAMQGTGIGTLIQFGLNGVPLTPQAAEEEYNLALTRLNGEQYELMPPPTPDGYTKISPLYTIRHVHRTNPTTTKVLGIYYILEGVIYKSPGVRSLMKANVARTLEGLSSAFAVLSKCAKYQTSSGYIWVFEEDEENEDDPIALLNLAKRRKRRKILDNRRPGERTDAEEEGIRASEAIDRILVRLAESPLLNSVDKKNTKKDVEVTDTVSIKTMKKLSTDASKAG